jgi:hypothetical protein
VEPDEEYPKTRRRRTRQIEARLGVAPDLDPRQREEIAMCLNDMSDKARDLDDIVDRLLNEPHTPAEVGALLIAFELTTEQIRGCSDVIDGKLYKIGDQLKVGALAERKERPTRNRATRKTAAKWSLDAILDLLDQYQQRATYGAVGGVLGVPPMSVLRKRPRDPRHSWIVNQETGAPTGYTSEQCHAQLRLRATIIDTPAALHAWLRNAIES